MKNCLHLLLLILLTACGTNTGNKSEGATIVGAPDSSVSAPVVSTEDISEEDTIVTEYATFYVVVADTGNDYYKLRKEMLEVSLRHNIKVDTMGRYYNAGKDLIALPDNDEDEMYAGDYFPRRFPSPDLSLEYLLLYMPKSGEKTMAILSGIFETPREADSVTTIIKKTAGKAFRVESEIYMGCLH